MSTRPLRTWQQIEAASRIPGLSRVVALVVLLHMDSPAPLVGSADPVAQPEPGDRNLDKKTSTIGQVLQFKLTHVAVRSVTQNLVSIPQMVL